MIVESCRVSTSLAWQVVDYYRHAGRVADIQAGKDQPIVADDIRTVLKDTARS